MGLDLYAPCVCGSGKKIKFCCSDVSKELDSIMAAIEGGQRISALDQINRALDTHPNSPALLALKGSVLLELNEFDNARKTVDHFLELAPQNPVALAQSAVLCALDSDVKEAVLKTQQALESAGKEVPLPLYEAVAALSGVLLQLGHYLAGKQHLVLQVGLEGGGEESPAFRQYIGIRGLESVPLLLRGDFNLRAPSAEGEVPAADIAAWNAALESSKFARWFQAVEQFLTLATKHRQNATLWHNIAVLYGWLADEASASRAWRQKARCPGVSAWDALEAEAVAQILDEPADVDMLPRVAVEFPVSDPNGLKEKLLSTRQLLPIQIDPAQFRNEENEVPPLAAFTALSAEPPAESENLSMEQLPETEGSLLLYGKQTDRDARITFVTVKDQDFERQLADVKSVLGINEHKEPETVGEVRRFNRLWEFSRHVPTWAKPDQIKGWVEGFRQKCVLSNWENMPQSFFGGKSAAEAVQDENQKLAVSAALLELEITLKESGSQLQIDETRQKWNLPRPPLSATTPNEISKLPVWQWYWVDLSLVPIESLERALNVAISVRARGVTQRIGEALIARGKPEMHEQVYAIMAQMATNSDAALASLTKAKELRMAAGGSPATFLLMELPLRLRRGEAEEAQRVFAEIRSKHLDEPGVANALTQIMVDMGLVSPQQLAAAQSRSMPSPIAGADSPAPARVASVTGTPAPTWTPGQPIAAGEQPAQKSKLWLPGD